MEKNIKKILETLENEGYQAYLVGGYVRDYLLGVTSFDVDIATDALPKDIHRIFNSSKNNYGSVNIKVDKLNVDITTFRKDLNYVNRRPSKVVYINNLKEDLDADSLDAVELIMAVEEEFDIEIPDEKAAEIKTVQDIVDYIKANA